MGMDRDSNPPAPRPPACGICGISLTYRIAVDLLPSGTRDWASATYSSVRGNACAVQMLRASVRDDLPDGECASSVNPLRIHTYAQKCRTHSREQNN